LYASQFECLFKGEDEALTNLLVRQSAVWNRLNHDYSNSIRGRRVHKRRIHGAPIYCILQFHTDEDGCPDHCSNVTEVDILTIDCA
jgi:hypothetical protein